MPTPLQEVAGEGESPSKPPQSPTDTKDKMGAPGGESPADSPKPKKSTFLRSLQRKSKTEGSSGGGVGNGESSALTTCNSVEGGEEKGQQSQGDSQTLAVSAGTLAS